MERYAPTIKDLAPRDIVARCMVQEVAEGRGAGPHKDYVLLDCTHLGAEVLETKLPDITEFARTYLGVDPVYEPVPVMPTAHYAMGGIPTNVDAEVLRDNTTVVPGPLRRRRVRLRLGARLEPPRHQLAARHQRLRQARRPQRGRVRARRPTSCRCPRTRPATCAACSRSSATPTAPSASPRSARSCRTRWTRTPRCSAPTSRSRTCIDVIAGLRERYKNIAVQDKGKRFNTDLLEAVELGFLLDLAEVVVVLRSQPQGEPRRPHARRLPEPRRRELHAAHDGLPVGRRRTRRTPRTTSGSTGSR